MHSARASAAAAGRGLTTGRASALAALVLAGVLTGRESPLMFAAQPAAVALHDIQGAGSRSPFEGAIVTTSGVVRESHL